MDNVPPPQPLYSPHRTPHTPTQLLNMFSVTSLAFLAWIVAFSVPMFFDKFSDAPWMVNAKKAVEVNVKKVCHLGPGILPPNKSDNLPRHCTQVPALSKALGYDEKKTE